MLTAIVLDKFKCFESVRLHLAPLTLFCGVNASGKSSVLQALCLLHQTIVADEWSSDLQINGEQLSLGMAQDIVNSNEGRYEFSIGVEWRGKTCLWTMESQERHAMTIPIKKITWDRTNEFFWDSLERIHNLLPEHLLSNDPVADELSKALERIVYLSAERFGPRETYILDRKKNDTDVGVKGERTAAVLYLYGEEHVTNSLCLPGIAPILSRQVEAYLSHFFPGTSMDLQPVLGANIVTLGLKTSKGSKFYRPQNVGYGLTQTLPIITACLAAKPGDTVLIENPEVHLHPAGQSLMGRFLATVAATGVTTLIETHSDHIINGIRVASVDNHPIGKEDVCIHNFSLSPEGNSRSEQIYITETGNLTNWPKGFFDQAEKDLLRIVQSRRKG